jgi:hypothetical protein
MMKEVRHRFEAIGVIFHGWRIVDVRVGRIASACQPYGITLDVFAGCGIVVAKPVLLQPRLPIEDLPREA